MDNARHVMSCHSTQETKVYLVEDDVAGIVCQAHVMSFHLIQSTGVYNVEDDVAGIIYQAHVM